MTGYIDGLDTFHVNARPMELADIDSFDAANRILLLKYLEILDFPRIAEVGRRSTRTVSLMLLHSGDTSLMQRYLPALESRCIEGEAEWDCYAMMSDRLRVYLGLPQLYGTQKIYTDASRTIMQYAPMGDLEDVNRRRRRFGMPPLVEYEVRRQ
jgi:hypothetical protein